MTNPFQEFWWGDPNSEALMFESEGDTSRFIVIRNLGKDGLECAVVTWNFEKHVCTLDEYYSRIDLIPGWIVNAVLNS